MLFSREESLPVKRLWISLARPFWLTMILLRFTTQSGSSTSSQLIIILMFYSSQIWLHLYEINYYQLFKSHGGYIQSIKLLKYTMNTINQSNSYKTVWIQSINQTMQRQGGRLNQSIDHSLKGKVDASINKII